MLYIAYLDEFGHIGPYLSHDHPRHSTHPAFGLAGVVLPYTEVRNFSTFFFQLKNNLLAFELNRSGSHPAKWEKKGSSLYTIQNISTYRVLRQATNRLLNKIKKINGFVFYVGMEKRRDESAHDSKRLYHSVLREAIKRLDQESLRLASEFMLVLDQQEENVLRGEIVETASIEMFGASLRSCLIEPPMQVESHLFQTVQCADWLCGLVGRLAHFSCEPEVKPDFSVVDQFFGERLKEVVRRSSIRMLPRPATPEQLNALARQREIGDT
jgi:hypothetical protein